MVSFLMNTKGWIGRCIPARERMIGWYHTGPKLRASDQEINDLFKRFIAKHVMVIVDVRPNTVEIPTDAVEEIKDVSPHHHSISGSFSDGHQDGTETRKAFLRIPPQPKPKKWRKLTSRIYYGISKIPQRQHLPRE